MRRRMTRSAARTMCCAAGVAFGMVPFHHAPQRRKTNFQKTKMYPEIVQRRIRKPIARSSANREGCPVRGRVFPAECDFLPRLHARRQAMAAPTVHADARHVGCMPSVECPSAAEFPGLRPAINCPALGWMASRVKSGTWSKDTSRGAQPPHINSAHEVCERVKPEVKKHQHNP